MCNNRFIFFLSSSESKYISSKNITSIRHDPPAYIKREQFPYLIRDSEMETAKKLPFKYMGLDAVSLMSKNDSEVSMEICKDIQRYFMAAYPNRHATINAHFKILPHQIQRKYVFEKDELYNWLLKTFPDLNDMSYNSPDKKKQKYKRHF